MEEVNNFKNMCRICLTSRNTFKVMDTSNCDRKGYIELIKECSSCNQVILDEKLPDYVCFRCAKILDTYYDFRLQIFSSEEKLLRLLQDPKGLASKSEGSYQNGKISQALIQAPKGLLAAQNERSEENVKLSQVMMQNPEGLLAAQNERSDENVKVSEAMADEYHCFVIHADDVEPVLKNENLTLDEEVKPADVKLKAISEEYTVKDEEGDMEGYEAINDLSYSDDGSELNLNQDNLTLTEGKPIIKARPITAVEREQAEKIIALEMRWLEIINHNAEKNGKPKIDIKPNLEKLLQVKHECQVCLTVFNNPEELEEHVKTHPDSSTFVCKFCDKSFAKKPYLRYHLQRHAVGSPYLCNECGTTYKSGKGLESHLMVHAGIKPFKCEICGDQFTHNRLLVSHLDVHKTVKDFICKYCGKCFARRAKVRQHEKLHVAERKYECSFCPKKFITWRVLKKHEHEVHTYPNTRLYFCEICLKRFKRSTHLRTHLKAHTKEDRSNC